MDKTEALESAGIIIRLCQNLLATVSSYGRAASDARTACGDLVASAYTLARNDNIAWSLDRCFQLIWLAGATQPEMASVRVFLEAEQPTTLGGVATQNLGIRLCLAIECSIIINMQFLSREDVDAVKYTMTLPFRAAEEIAADDMDQTNLMPIIRLWSALINYLCQKELPLPQMLNYWFADVFPSLLLSQRLYSDASNADAIRNGNKIVHPAFCPPTGKALASS
jgi:prophage DNA circulation protein